MKDIGIRCSLGLLKMRLAWRGQTDVTAEDNDLLVPYLTGIAKEVANTAVENGQDPIIEGRSMPFDRKDDFGPERLSEIRSYDAHCISFEPFGVDDADDAEQLFHETVHTVNARDYTASQLDAWAPHEITQRNVIVEKLRHQSGVSVRECGILIGFGTLSEDGVDMLYVHKDRQGQGIARRILQELERMSADRGLNESIVYASITARPFFERMGYRLACENTVVRHGVTLANYRMSKPLTLDVIGQESDRNASSRLP